MKVERFLIMITRAPVGSDAGVQGLDLALAAAAFDQQVTVIFKDEGVLQLHRTQEAKTLGNKNTLPQFGLMEMYGVQAVGVCETSLQQMNITAEQLAHSPTIMSDQELNHAIKTAQHVWVF